jgi:hypothetical protein
VLFPVSPSYSTPTVSFTPPLAEAPMRTRAVQWPPDCDLERATPPTLIDPGLVRHHGIVAGASGAHSVAELSFTAPRP